MFNLLTNVYHAHPRDTILIDGHATAGKKTYQVNRMGIARTFQNIRLFKETERHRQRARWALHESDEVQLLASSLLRLPDYWKEEEKCTERAIETCWTSSAHGRPGR